MKKTIILLLVAVIAASCAKEPKFVISGTIEGAGNETVILQKRIPGGYEGIDTAVMENGVFKLEGVVAYPQLVNLAIQGKRGGLNFYIENSEITINGNADSLYMAVAFAKRYNIEGLKCNRFVLVFLPPSANCSLIRTITLLKP